MAMFGANSILDMGRWALFASQAQIQVTGENIANVNTEGYSRRSVRLEENIAIDYRPGQMGTGVRAAEVVRSFDNWIEEQYLDQSSVASRWSALYNNLSSVESLFNESQGYGLSQSLSEFFQSWNDLTQYPDDYSSRSALLDTAITLNSSLKTMDANLDLMQQRVNELIAQDVEDANLLIEKIADLNKQITLHEKEGQNNPNGLYDERSLYIRKLSEIIDINVIDNTGGDMTITTKSGQTLVDGISHFGLTVKSAQTLKELDLSSNFDGQVYYTGTDNYEYTLEVVQGGSVSDASGTGTAMFRVSMDGGKTWLQDENGNDKLYYARDEDSMVQVEDLTIWFGQDTDSRTAPTTQLTAGDRFQIIPQSGLYWVQNTSHEENITPLIDFTGHADSSRCTGGTLAAYFNFRDNFVGEYRDKLDGLAETLAWEVNRRHSQGAGLEAFDYVQGTYSVDAPDRALGSDSSGLPFSSKLQSGSSMFYVYDTDTGLLVSGAALDFDGTAGGAQGNFDPNSHTLTDVVDAVNNSFGTYVTASIVNNQLVIDANDGYEFQFGTDSTGLWAALGVNTFFTGSSAGDLEINSYISGDLNRLNTGHVNGAGEFNTGDISVATAIADLEDVDVDIYTIQDGYSSQSLLDYYNSIVGSVGTDVASTEYSYNYSKALADDLNDRQQEVSGVNLDEEMANLIKYQHAYTAAAKLITTADQMLQTVLSLKP